MVLGSNEEEIRISLIGWCILELLNACKNLEFLENIHLSCLFRSFVFYAKVRDLFNMSSLSLFIARWEHIYDNNYATLKRSCIDRKLDEIWPVTSHRWRETDEREGSKKQFYCGSNGTVHSCSQIETRLSHAYLSSTASAPSV